MVVLLCVCVWCFLLLFKVKARGKSRGGTEGIASSPTDRDQLTGVRSLSVGCCGRRHLVLEVTSLVSGHQHPSDGMVACFLPLLTLRGENSEAR